MPLYDLTSSKTGRTYQVEFANEPNDLDIDEAIAAFDAEDTAVEVAPAEQPGFGTQLYESFAGGGGLALGGGRTSLGVLTGDVPGMAAGLTQMQQAQARLQASQTPEDVAFAQDIAQQAQEMKDAEGFFPTVAEAIDLPLAALRRPGAALRTAVQSLPNVAVTTPVTLAGGLAGAAVGAAAGLPTTGPGAVATGLAGGIATGTAANAAIEVGYALNDLLNERTGGASATMNEEQIAAYLEANPDIVDEAQRIGLTRGATIGAVEALGLKGAGRLTAAPARAAEQAARTALAREGVDLASRTAVREAMATPALRQAAETAAKAATDQFNLPARALGAVGIEAGAAAGGELAAQAAAGQELDYGEAFLETLGEGLAAPATVLAARRVDMPAGSVLNPPAQQAVQTAAVAMGDEFPSVEELTAVAGPEAAVEVAAAVADAGAVAEPVAPEAVAEEVQVQPEEVVPEVQPTLETSTPTESLPAGQAQAEATGQQPATQTPDETEIPEASGLPPVQSQPVVQTPAVEAQEGVALGGREGQEGQVIPEPVQPMEVAPAPIKASELEIGDTFQIGDRVYQLGSKLRDGRLRATQLDPTTFEPLPTPAGYAAGTGVVIPKNRNVNRVQRPLPAPQAEIVSPEGVTPPQPLPPTGGVPTESLPAGQPTSGDVGTALRAVATNTATPEQVASLEAQGLARTIQGQPVITDAGLAQMPEAERPRLTEAERVAEIQQQTQDEQLTPRGAAMPAGGEAVPSITEADLRAVENRIRGVISGADDARGGGLRWPVSFRGGAAGRAEAPQFATVPFSSIRAMVESLGARFEESSDPNIAFSSRVEADGSQVILLNPRNVAAQILASGVPKAEASEVFGTAFYEEIVHLADDANARAEWSSLPEDTRGGFNVYLRNRDRRITEEIFALVRQSKNPQQASKILSDALSRSFNGYRSGQGATLLPQNVFAFMAQNERASSALQAEFIRQMVQQDLIGTTTEVAMLRRFIDRVLAALDRLISYVSATEVGAFGDTMKARLQGTKDVLLSALDQFASQTINTPSSEIQPSLRPLTGDAQRNETLARRRRGKPTIPTGLRTVDGAPLSAITVTTSQATQARTLEAAQTPGAQDTWIGTAEEYLAENPDAAFVADNATLEAFYDPAVDRAVILTDRVQVREGDAVRAARNGTSAGLEAVRRLIRHESFVHRGWRALPKNLKDEFLSISENVVSADDLDQLVKTYRRFASWRIDPAIRALAVEEWLAQRLERIEKLPAGSDSVLNQLVDWAKRVWQWLAGDDSVEPTRRELVDLMRQMVRALETGEKVMPPHQEILPSLRKQSLRVKMTRSALTDAALSQESWRDWYEEHQATLDEFFGEYAQQFQDILAVTSQAASVKANVGLALKAFGQWHRGEEFVGFLPAVAMNLNRLRDNAQIQGQKISTYKKNNDGTVDEAVIDRHITRLLFGVDTPSAAQFAKAQRVLAEIANGIGWTPRQVQAALWAHSIYKSGKTPESYGAYLKKLEAAGAVTDRIGSLGARGPRSDVYGGGRGRFAPPSPGQAEDGSLRFSLTDTDAAYMDAVARGDMETAQRLVDEAAKKAGYGQNQYSKNDFDTWAKTIGELDQIERIAINNSISAEQALKNTNISPVLRKVAQSSLERNKKKAQEIQDKKQKGPSPKRLVRGDSRADITVYRGVAGRSIWATDSEQVAKTYGDNVRSFFLEMKNPLVVDADGRSFKELSFEDSKLDADDLSDIAKERGYDGLIIRNFYDSNTDDGGDVIADHFTIFNPSQIKSADPITYDDAGNVIPLSQRFQPESPDIRFSLTGNEAEIERIIREDRDDAESGVVPTRARPLAPGASPTSATEQLGPRTVNGKKIDGQEIIERNMIQESSTERSKAKAIEIVNKLGPMSTWLSTLLNPAWQEKVKLNIRSPLGQYIIAEALTKVGNASVKDRLRYSTLNELLASQWQSAPTESATTLAFRSAITKDPRYAALFAVQAMIDEQRKQQAGIIDPALGSTEATVEATRNADTQAQQQATEDVDSELRLKDALYELGLAGQNPDTQQRIRRVNDNVFRLGVLARLREQMRARAEQASFVSLSASAVEAEYAAMSVEQLDAEVARLERELQDDLAALETERRKVRATKPTGTAKTVVDQAKDLIEKLEAAPGVKKTPKPNPVRDLYKAHLKQPMAEGDFVRAMVGQGVPEADAQKLYELAAVKIAAAEATKVAGRTARLMDRETSSLENLINKLRPKITGGLNWREIFDRPLTNQREWRQQLFDTLRADPALANLSPAEARDLAAEIDRIWNTKREAAFKALAKRMNLPGAREGVKEKIAESAPALIRYINSGAFNDVNFRNAIADKFGVPQLDEARVDEVIALVQKAQEAETQVERNKFMVQAIRLMQEGMKAELGGVISNYWVTSVLSGFATLFDMAMSVLNGARVMTQFSADAIIRQRDFKLAGRAAKNYFQSLGNAILESTYYFVSGDPSMLDNYQFTLNTYLREGSAAANPFDYFERIIKDPSKPSWAKIVPYYFAGLQRLMTAFDHINSTSTAQGTLEHALAYNRKLFGDARMPSQQDVAAARAKAVQLAGGDRTFAQKRKVTAYTRQILNEEFNKTYPGILDEAKDIGRIAAYQNDPTGIGGIIYHTLLGLTNKAVKAAGDFRDEGRALGEAQGIVSKFMREFMYILAVNSRNISGTRFVRFVGNRVNELISFTPGAGFLRLYEKDTSPTRRAMLLQNQAVGILLGVWVTATLLRMMGDEEDDEKRGFRISGSWQGLTPDRKNQLRANNMTPNSVQIWDGEKWVNFNYTPWPVASLLATVGNLADMKKYHPERWGAKEPLDRILAAAWAGAFSFKDLSAISGFMDMFGASAYSGDPVDSAVKWLGKFSSNYVGGVVPRMLKDIDMIMDPKARKPTDISEHFAKELPFYRRTEAGGERMYNIFGEQVELSRLPWRRVVTASRPEKEYQILAELNNRGLFLGVANPDNRTVGYGASRRELTDEEAERYSVETGKRYRQFILDQGERLLEMPEERAKEFISRRTEALRNAALRDAIRTQP